MLADQIIEEQLLRRDGNRYSVSVRIPWYRTLPLSSVTALEFVLDGEAAAADSLTWTVNGQTYRPEELPPRYDTWWNVLDSAVLSGEFTSDHSGTTDVRVQIGLYIPYLAAGDRFLQIAENDHKQLETEQAA